ncbi:MAG: hypothetical protein JWO36_4207 [Myxococcales bacterium]|nr:hypothetical protein [Myxococcales bacterium]
MKRAVPAVPVGHHADHVPVASADRPVAAAEAIAAEVVAVAIARLEAAVAASAHHAPVAVSAGHVLVVSAEHLVAHPAVMRVVAVAVATKIAIKSGAAVMRRRRSVAGVVTATMAGSLRRA